MGEGQRGGSEPLGRTPDPRPCPTPDPESQALSPFEADIVEVEQRTFLFLKSKADSVAEISWH